MNEKPELLEDEELVYRMERRDGSYTKTYLKKSIYEDLPDDIDLPRKFSKLKLYGNCQSIGVWTTLVDWMKNTLTPNGINLKDAFDYA